MMWDLSLGPRQIDYSGLPLEGRKSTPLATAKPALRGNGYTDCSAVRNAMAALQRGSTPRRSIFAKGPSQEEPSSSSSSPRPSSGTASASALRDATAKRRARSCTIASTSTRGTAETDQPHSSDGGARVAAEPTDSVEDRLLTRLCICRGQRQSLPLPLKVGVLSSMMPEAN
eukprot:TRINITY_DN29130_c0_g1_i2.p1 TRINITY_DN29130_c0_g1~~TRINITY_DN29130_c0_g1_i2.p1  ORF type:complete len:172 (+),score=8.45 TRINITY_DN29130_c0_g1_i2:49-564(+)